MKKRNILTLALVLCLIAIMACGSLAYFTSTKTVTNVFKTSAVPPSEDTDGDGDVDEDDVTADDIFSIVVTETNNNPDDDPNTEDDTTTTGNTYEEVLPGTTFTKDPTVKNTGAYDAYVRVSVTVDCAKEWQEVIAKHLAKGTLTAGSNGKYDLASIFDGYDDTAWSRMEEIPDTEKNTLTYVYYLNEELKPGEEATLFDSVTIPTCLDAEDMLKLKEFSLTVTADAIQTANTSNDDGVDDAFEAFRDYWDVNN